MFFSSRNSGQKRPEGKCQVLEAGPIFENRVQMLRTLIFYSLEFRLIKIIIMNAIYAHLIEQSESQLFCQQNHTKADAEQRMCKFVELKKFLSGYVQKAGYV